MSEAWYEVGKWSIDANISPLLDKVLTEFTSRIDDELFQMLSQETICILDYATGTSTIRVIGIQCQPHAKHDLTHNVYILVFRPEMGKLSPKAALGEVAHQFAHLVLRLQHGMDTENIPSGEEMANALAIGWGFKEEIETNTAEWEQLESQGVTNLKKRDGDTKPAKKKREKT